MRPSGALPESRGRLGRAGWRKLCRGRREGRRGRSGAPAPRRGASPRLSRPLLRCQHASAPELRPGGLGRRGAQRKSFIVSHLDLDSECERTAFPVSRETVLHVCLTSGRGDVTAHACSPTRRMLPWPSRPHAPGGSGKADGGVLRKELVLYRALWEGRRGRKGPSRRGRAGSW